jgi:hypothetical protein
MISPEQEWETGESAIIRAAELVINPATRHCIFATPIGYALRRQGILSRQCGMHLLALYYDFI